MSSIATAMFCSSAALAADLPVQPPPVYVPPTFTWTGFYLGANLGFGGDRFVYPFSAAAVDGSAGFGGSVSITSEGGWVVAKSVTIGNSLIILFSASRRISMGQRFAGR
jgi:outer membrane immunogenic protein